MCRACADSTRPSLAQVEAMRDGSCEREQHSTAADECRNPHLPAMPPDLALHLE